MNEQEHKEFKNGVTFGHAYAVSPYWLAGYWFGFWAGMLEKGFRKLWLARLFR